MKEQSIPENYFSENFQPDEGLDIKAIIFKFLNYWYWFVLTLVVAMAGAYLFNRYAEPVYKASGTVLVSDENQNESTLFSKSVRPLFSRRVNLENEIAVLNSYKMKLNAAREMNWQTTVTRQGQFRPNEVYENRPFIIEFDTSHVQPVNTNMHVEVDNLSHYRLTYGRQEKDAQISLYDFQKEEEVSKIHIPEKTKKLKFGKWYTTPHCSFRLVVNKSYSDFTDGEINTDDDKVFWFTFNSLESAVKQNGGFQIEKQSQESDIIKIAKEGENKNRATAQVNALLEAYVNYNLEEKNKRSVNTISFIDNQLEALNDTMQKVEQRLQEFQSENRILEISDKAQPIFAELNKLENNRAMESLKMNYYEFVEDYIQQSNKDKKTIIAPSTIGIEDELLSELVTNLNELYSKRSEMLITSTEKDPRVKAIQKRVNQAENALLENISNIVQHSKIKIRNLDKRINKIQKEISTLPFKERQLVNIRRKYEVNDKIYTFLLQRRAETGIQKAGNVSDYKVINKSRSGSVIFPKPSMNYSIAFILGIMLPLVIILIRDFFDNKIHTHDEIQKLTSVPVLGVINHSRLSTNTSVIFKPKSILAESFRALRTSLQFYMPGKDKKVITVTSTLSGEGKTFISINLASIMALSGRKTLVISGDLRKPRVFDDFNLSNETGLTSYLIGKQNKEDLVQFSGFENLYVVTSGPVPPHPSELLETQKMRDLLDEFKKDFDFIVIDTPPIGLVTDAIYLMNQSDAVVYAARQNYTPKNAINTLNDFMEKSQIKNVSLVLNDVELEKGKYSGYGYGSQYGYGYGYGYGYAYGSSYYVDEEHEKKSFWQRLFQS